MKQVTQIDLKTQIQPIQDLNLASRAKQQILSFANRSALEQNRLTQQLAIAEDWKLWHLGGFCFSDGSVLWRSSSGWESFGVKEANNRLETSRKQPLEVRLSHVFVSSDGRERHSISEAHFMFQALHNRWQLEVEYEAFMDSPLHGLKVEKFEELPTLRLLKLWVDTPRMNQRWRLEQIALHPDWLELLNCSRAPD
jgi:hypothetical protein